MQGRGYRGLTPGLIGLIALLAVLPSVPGVARALNDADLLHCEEAAAHVQECCGTLGMLHCQYVPWSEGCGSEQEGVDPSFSRVEAGCILEASCAKLVSQGICEAIQNDARVDPTIFRESCQ